MSPEKAAKAAARRCLCGHRFDQHVRMNVSDLELEQADYRVCEIRKCECIGFELPTPADAGFHLGFTGQPLPADASPKMRRGYAEGCDSRRIRAEIDREKARGGGQKGPRFGASDTPRAFGENPSDVTGGLRRITG